MADNNRNIAYHGFIGGQIKSSEEGDELDYPESSFEMSIFCGGKLIDGTDYHYGIGEWGINYYPEARLVRYMVLSHFSDSIHQQLFETSSVLLIRDYHMYP